MLTTAKSDFVMGRIKNRKFSSDRFYHAMDMILIEKFVLGRKPKNESWTRFLFLNKEYPKETQAIIKELNPQFDLQTAERKSREEWKRQVQQEEGYKKFWKNIGGRL